MNLDTNKIVHMYNVDKLSVRLIAEKLQTYPNAVRRTLIKAGIKLRDKSEAQKTAMDANRSLHPTKGKKLSSEQKAKISEAKAAYWQELTDEKREAFIEKARERWNNISDTEREEIQKMAGDALRKAAKEGSKIEQFLRQFLTINGYDVVFHKSGLIANENFEVDLFLPRQNIIIEIDGPTHFLPIWGELNLRKHIKADLEKSGLLISRGFTVIRVKHIHKSLTQKLKRDVGQQILAILQEIDGKVLTEQDRYIEVEA